MWTYAVVLTPDDNDTVMAAVPDVHGVLDLQHASKLDAIVEALRVLGREVEVTVRPAKSRPAA